MPPKRTKQTEEELSIVKQQLDTLQEDIHKILKNQNQFHEILQHIETLKKENIQLKEELATKEARIRDLETRTDSLEQYTRSEDLIISGLNVTHRSYANTVRQNASRQQDSPTEIEDTPEENQNLELQVIDFCNSKGINLKEEEISACHQLRSKKQTKDIVIRVVNRKTKSRIMKQVKTNKALKNTNIFISEHLTTKNQELAAIGRRLKRKGQILSSWVRNGRVFIKFKEEDRPVFIKDRQQFSELGLNIENVFK